MNVCDGAFSNEGISPPPLLPLSLPLSSSPFSPPPLLDLDLRYFWSWSAFEDYLLFCFAFTVLCAFLTLLLLDSVLFVEGLGSLAVLFEAMLGVPQLLQNFHNHSTRGMR